MDQISLEILCLIAENLELADLYRWTLTCKRINFSLGSILHAKAVALDQERGWPYYLVRAALADNAANAFKILLQQTKLQDINTANIDMSKVPGYYNRSLLEPSELVSRDIPRRLTSLLHVASQLCSQDVLKLVLSRGAIPDILDTYGWAPLHLAAWNGKEDAMRILVDGGADIELRKIWNQPPLFDRYRTEHSGTTPLHQAASRGHLRAVEMLLAAGADPKISCHEMCDALGATAKSGYMDVFRRLLEEEFDSATLTAALKYAAEGEDAAIVARLLQLGAVAHDALVHAVQHDRLDNMRLLFDAMADPKRDLDRRNVLHRVRSIAATEIILARAPGLSAAARPGMFHGTPLETLYDYGREHNPQELEGIAMMLIEDGCLIREPRPIDEDNDRLPSNRNVLEDAAFWGHTRVIEALLSRKKSLLHVRYRGHGSPLSAAAYSASDNKLACFKLLVEAGADIHADPILWRLYSMSLQVAGTPRPLVQNALVTQFLIDLGVDINSRSESEYPLIHALCMENDQSAMLLIKAGADITVRSGRRLSTLQEAARHGCLEAMEYLLKSNNVEELMTSPENEPLLHLVTCEGHLKHGKVKGYVKMMGHLLLGHLDISPEDVAGDDAAELKDLAYTGRMEVVRRLCKRNIVDPGAKHFSRTAFDQLAAWHHEELIDLSNEAHQKWPRPPPTGLLRLLHRRMD
ncbi:ankyrin repeat-containing domain protein [Trichoderma novae-zelandiae]